jgi:hypothetical protein
MRPPSAREAKGYDIVVWVDEEGDIVTRAFTKRGDNALKTFVNEYSKGDIVQIYSSPTEFEASLPNTLAVGYLTSKGMRPMRSSALH